MPRKVIFTSVFSIAFALSVSPQLAHSAKPEAEIARTAGDIMGQVQICSSLAVDRLLVHIPGRSYSAITDSNGGFVFNFVPEGQYNLVFESDGETISTLSSISVVAKSITDLGTIQVCIDADGDGFVATEDCDDNDPNINPDATELCNDIDDNCDRVVDEGFDKIAYYRDSDHDQFGDATRIKESCVLPDGYVENDYDCNDHDPYVNPLQVNYFRSASSGSWDYNCNDVEELKEERLGECSLLSGCELTWGWDAEEPPACGDSQLIIQGCNLTLAGCNESTVLAYQECR